MKPGTFTQIYIQLVFAVKNRDALITEAYKLDLYKYVSGIIAGLNHKTIIVNGMHDHIHILFGLNPAISISDTVHDIKRSSSLFINKNNFTKHHFSWQEGYGAFSYSRSQHDRVYKYIEQQEGHHQTKSFKSEYISFLDHFGIKYDPQYLFDFDAL